MIAPNSRLTIAAEWVDEANEKQIIAVEVEAGHGDLLQSALNALKTQIEKQAFGRDAFAEMMAMGRALIAAGR